MTAVRLELPYPPSANRYWRHTRTGKVYVSEEAETYRKRVRWLAMLEKTRPLEGPVSVTVRVFRKARRGDLDNALKVLFDALEGCAYGNDDQVVELHALRFEDPSHPRVEVVVQDDSI